MKIIYSHWSPAQNLFKELIACSNYYTRLHGYETILFTDEEGKENLKTVNFSEIRLFSDKINNLPTNIESLGKLVAINQINEPFLYINNDLFLYKNAIKNHLDKPVVAFYNKPIEFQYRHLSNVIEYFNKFENCFPEELKNGFELNSNNFSIFGGSSFEVFKEITDIILDSCAKNHNIINNFKVDKNDNKNLSNFVEGVWMTAMLKNRNLSPDYILNNIGSTTEEIDLMAKQEGIAYFSGNYLMHKEVIIKLAKSLKVSY